MKNKELRLFHPRNPTETQSKHKLLLPITNVLMGGGTFVSG
jgi:hypothetical protein